MPDPVYPCGYLVDEHQVQGMGTMLTMAELAKRATVKNAHPEFWRRVAAWMRYCRAHGYPLGPGTLWRSYATQEAAYIKDPVGHAPPKNSNHCGTSTTQDTDAIAADMVPATSWAFARQCAPMFGLVVFVASTNSKDWGIQGRSYTGIREDWHAQPYEVNYSRGGRTERANLWTWPIDPQWESDVAVVPAPPTPPLEADMPTFVNERTPGGPFRIAAVNGGATIPVVGAKGAKGAQVNVTAIGVGTARGFLAVSGNTGKMPGTSVVEVIPGEAHSNVWSGAVNGDGAIDVYLGGALGVAVDVIVDAQLVWP